MEGGNSLEQAVALVAAANRVVQDPNSVGSALRTISLRLRGTSLEVLEEMGEETDGVVTSVSKLQAKIKALTGVNILTDSGAYKDTYTILNEIGQVWEDMSDIDQAALLELMAGKNRANTLAAILGNMDDLEGAYQSALKAEGSAMRENEAYLDSIQGRIDLFNNATQTMWMNFIESDAVKFIVDLGTQLVKLIDKVGLLKSLLTTVGAVWVNKTFGKDLAPLLDMSSGKGAKTDFFASLKNKLFGTGTGKEATPPIINTEPSRTHLRLLDDKVDKTKVKLNEAGNTGEQAGEQIQDGAIKGSTSWAKFGKELWRSIKIAAMMYAITDIIDKIGKAITYVIESVRQQSETFDALQEKYEEYSSKLAECEAELSSLEARLDDTNNKIEELMDQGTLSFVEKEELERLRDVSAELERQIGMTETLQSSLLVGTNSAALKAGGAYLSTSFESEKTKEERQAESAESGESIGGFIVGIIGGLVGAYFGGAAGAGVGYSVGSGIGGGIGSWIGSESAGAAYDSEQTVEQAIEDMAAERKRLAQARDEAYAAYANSPNNTQAQADFEKTSQDLLFYDQQMAAHITQLSQYYNVLMANWNNMTDEQKEANAAHLESAIMYGDMIDKYNIAMGGVNAKQNAIDRIFGSEASTDLQKVKKELEEMAKAGEDVDLEKAFDDPEAYDAFVRRLWDMGIYVYELEDAFENLEFAEEGAAGVDFSGIVKDVKNVADAISGIQTAFDEFAQSGYVAPDTILGLEQYFKTDELAAMYEEYIGVIISGNSTLADVQEASRKLAQGYLESMLALGEITPAQKQAYASVLKSIGVVNAEEFIEQQVQQAALQKMIDVYNKHLLESAANAARGAVLDVAGVGGKGLMASALLTTPGSDVATEIQAIIDQYGLNAHIADQLTTKLEERFGVSKDLFAARRKKDEYGTWKNQYTEAQEEAQNFKGQVLQSAADSLAQFIEYHSFTPFNPEGTEGHSTTAYYRDGNKQDTITSQEYAAIREKYEESRRKYVKAKQDYAAAAMRASGLRIDGQEKGWLDENGNIIEDVEMQLNQDIEDAQAALDAYDAELEAQLVLKYDLQIAGQEQAENTISSIQASIEQYNAALNIVDEVGFDGQRLSEEQYSALRDQLQYVTDGVEDFYTAVDTSNGYVVKDAALLKKLTRMAAGAKAANVKLASSQAKLRYYELSKKMRECIDVNGDMTAEQRAHILYLDQEMNSLEKMIATYSRLELELLGATNAYNKFEQAQQADAASDYTSNIESMVTALGEGFSTGDLGTESVQAAIEGLVHPSVLEGLTTAEEKMAAIYKYFKEGDLSKYITMEFDDDGAISSAEIKLGNVRRFIENGLWGDKNGDDINVFEGADWQHFEFSPKFLDGVEKADDKLQYFADQMGVTKEIAFAMIEAINDKDIEWLNGDYGSLFDYLVPRTLDSELTTITQQIADLNVQLAKGEITAEDYHRAMYGLEGSFKKGDINEEDYLQQKADEKAKLTNGEITAEEYRKNVFGLADREKAVQADVFSNTVSWATYTQSLTEYTDQLGELYNTLDGYTLNDDGKWTDSLGNIVEDAVINKLLADIDQTEGAIGDLSEKLLDLEEPTDVAIQFTMDEIDKELQSIQAEIGEVVEGTHYELDIETGKYTVMLDESDPNYDTVVTFVNWLNKKHLLEVALGENAPTVVDTVQQLNDTLTNIQKILEHKFNLQVDADGAIEEVSPFKTMWDGITDKSVGLFATITSFFKRVPADDGSSDGKSGGQSVNGTAHAFGTAHKSGDWGLPTNEHDSLVGELGPELIVDPQSGRYYTVGDRGAEFVDLKRGSIIFNHKQTESLLKNGYVTSRGKAYAEGNAHVTIWPNASSKDQWTGTGYAGWNSDASDLSDSLSDASDSVDEFKETIDWIEIRMEELDEALSRYSAKLENATNFKAKNDIIDEMVKVNRDIYTNAIAGAKYYEEYAAKYLDGMNDDLVAAAKNGAISITEFTKEQDEKTVEAIRNYRDYIQKAADLYQQAEETIAEIRDLAIQRVDNAYEHGSVRSTVEDSQTEKLQNAVDYDEARGLITSDAYYLAMMENSNKKIEYLTSARNQMQKELDEAVKNGEVIRGSNEWYELLDKMYQVDAEIDEATIELEEFQNAINDLYWDNFDQLINRLNDLKDETQSLIDLMDKDDMVTKPDGKTYENGTIKFWTEDDVEWTDEGLASLGLYAQQMEIAEYQSKQYAKAIDDLTAEYKAGHYSENEYMEKLNELKSAQYDSIEAYYDAQDAIKQLNETRIDVIKDGISKEIEAYEELIDKKREELDAEKDLYDFQKNVSEQQKNIADIQRKIAALSGDTSASAVAKRKKLEAELIEAQADLEESYYDRSVENQQNALDKELEDFQKEKEAEIEELDKWLENVEQVVTESLGIVQANATEIGATLTDKANEYNLTVSDAILTPWKDGSLAVSDYQTTFDTAMSSTMDQLEALKVKWQEVIDKMAEYGDAQVNAINKENAQYAAATKTPDPVPEKPATNEQNQEKSIAVGGKVNAGSAKIYGRIGGSASKQYFSKDPVYTVLAIDGDWVKVRHHSVSSGVSGWFKKSDIKAYAKGTSGVNKDQLAWIDEMGLEELVMHADGSGRLAFLSKGSAVVPHDISENLIKLGSLDPTEVLSRNTPQIGVHPEIHNTEISINMNIAEVVHVDKVTNDTLPDLTKVVKKQMDSYMTQLNNSIKKYTR